MELRLFDSDASSLQLWAQIAATNGLRFASCPYFDSSKYVPTGTPGLTIVAQAATSENYIELMIRLATSAPQQQFVATGHSIDVSDAAAMMHRGVAYVLSSPMDLDSAAFVVEFTMARTARSAALIEEFRVLSEEFSAVSKREFDVLNYVMAGASNRDSAAALDVSVRTVESRRAKLYRKLSAQCVAEVIRKVERLATLTAEIKSPEFPGIPMPTYSAVRKPEELPSVA